MARRRGPRFRRSRGLEFGYDRRRQEEEEKKGKKVIIFVVEIIVVILLAIGIVHFGGYRVSVPGTSMEPVLSEGEKVLVNRLSYQLGVPQAGDIIVFSKAGEDRSSYSIKRVIAVGGDKVRIEDGFLFVNGELYNTDGSVLYENAGVIEDDYTVAKDEYFVIGDNPATSSDSRFANVGTIKKEEIIGKVWYVSSPRDQRGTIKKIESKLKQ